MPTTATRATTTSTPAMTCPATPRKASARMVSWVTGSGDLQRGAARLALVAGRILREHAELQLGRREVGRDLPRHRARPLRLRLCSAGRDRREQEQGWAVHADDLPALAARVVDRVPKLRLPALRAARGKRLHR